MKNTIILKYLVGSLSDYEWRNLINGLSVHKRSQREIAAQLKSFRGESGSDVQKRRNQKGRSENFEPDKRRTSRMIAVVFDSIFNKDRHDFSKQRLSEAHLERIRVNKSISLLQLLSRKSLPLDWISRYVTSLLETCDDYEFIDEKITLKRKLIQLCLRMDLQVKADSIRVELGKDLQDLHDFITVECLVNRYLDQLNVDEKSDPVIIDRLVEAVELSSAFYSRSKLEHLDYFNRLLTIRLLIARHDYLNAASKLRELDEFCNSKPMLCCWSNLNRNQRLSALVNFFRWDFRQALCDCVRAGVISSGPIMELNLLREVEALSLIYLGEYAGAARVLEEMITTGPLGNNKLQFAKRHYLLAYALFLSGDTRKSFIMLQYSSAIGKHDECWNVGARLLYIYLNVYSGRFDVADSGIESLRKFLQRTSPARKYPPRLHLISRLLVKLSISAYEFPVFLRHYSSELVVLSSEDDDYKWYPGGFEVIPFNCLMESAMDGKRLAQLLVKHRSFDSVSISDS